MKVCMNQCPPYDFGLFRTLEIILGVVKGKQNAVTILDKFLSCWKLNKFQFSTSTKSRESFQKPY